MCCRSAVLLRKNAWSNWLKIRGMCELVFIRRSWMYGLDGTWLFSFRTGGRCIRSICPSVMYGMYCQSVEQRPELGPASLTTRKQTPWLFSIVIAIEGAVLYVFSSSQKCVLYLDAVKSLLVIYRFCSRSCFRQNYKSFAMDKYSILGRNNVANIACTQPLPGTKRIRATGAAAFLIHWSSLLSPTVKKRT